jgi:V/A-type H+-transporting ATPase subunit D
MPGSDVVATASAVEELQEERRMVQEGCAFLDEKRLLLVAEILRRLEEYRAGYAAFRAEWNAALESLGDALARHGLDELSVYPAAQGTAGGEAEVQVAWSALLGVDLQRVELVLPAQREGRAPVNPSPEARRCAERFRALLARSVTLAAESGNLHRLLAEYRRTARRARALEDVILPEVEATLHDLAERLEELDQEEAVRVRLGRDGRGP